MWRSQRILTRPEFSFNRSVYKSMGYSDNALSKPIIGIANAWSELVPGHVNLRAVSEAVKRGIHMAGGTAAEFGVPGACDGTAQGHVGMHYILPSRELIADSIEIMVQAHQLDGIVLLGSCDKIVPAMLMAAARLRIPAILLPGGPMLGGCMFDGRPSDLTSVSEAAGMLARDDVQPDELDRLENESGPCAGSCSFFGTANTMCCLSEALGMTLPGGALIPAVYAQRLRIAEESGRAIMALVEKNTSADKIITPAALRNAIVALMAIGGSTNAVLHLTAIANELGVDCNYMMRLFDELGTSTPNIVRVNPSGRFNTFDFFLSGGMPQVLYELRGLLDPNCLTVTGESLIENITRHGACASVNRDVIRSVHDPFSSSGGVAILYGNLAPDGCVTKPAAIRPESHVFTGRARVFDGEEAAERAILENCIHPGDVVVIRYEGPKGGPGMREMYKAMKYLYGMHLHDTTALVTDGRFSGTNNGCFVGHVSPEASEGGPIALVEDGDRITVDIPARLITLHVDDAEIAERRRLWTPPAQKVSTGYLARYACMAQSANRGAVLR